MIEIDPSIPEMSPDSAVFPTARQVESALYLAFYRPRCDVSVVLRFNGLRDWVYGYPNDEALDAHPLYGQGLEFYEFHRGPVGHFGERVWIATFHDGTLTVYAESVDVLSDDFSGAPWDAIDEQLGAGKNRVLDRE